MTELNTPEAVVDALEALYQEAVSALAGALTRYLQDGVPPSPEMTTSRAFCYPELRLTYAPDGPPPPFSRAFGKLSQAGVYVSTFTQPAFFREYLVEQLTPLMGDYDVTAEVMRSSSEIPYSYVWDQAQAEGLEDISPAELAKWFPAPDLMHSGDEVADGEIHAGGGSRPLAVFDGPRVDFSLKRLAHYCGTPVEQFQRYFLFTNYHRYVDEFCQWALTQIGEGGEYEALGVPGGAMVTRDDEEGRALIAAAPWRRYQMPAYHLMRKDGLESRSSTSASAPRTPRRSPITSPCCGPSAGSWSATAVACATRRRSATTSSPTRTCARTTCSTAFFRRRFPCPRWPRCRWRSRRPRRM